MTAFRGIKLIYKEGNRAWTALVQVMNPIQRRPKFDMVLRINSSFARLTLMHSTSNRKISKTKENCQGAINPGRNRQKKRADKVRRELEIFKHEESRSG
jgi:hypothetical protein